MAVMNGNSRNSTAGGRLRDQLSRPEGVVVVVDPYSSGRFLIDELHARGEKVVAVRSNLNAIDKILDSINPNDYFGICNFVQS